MASIEQIPPIRSFTDAERALPSSKCTSGHHCIGAPDPTYEPSTRKKKGFHQANIHRATIALGPLIPPMSLQQSRKRTIIKQIYIGPTSGARIHSLMSIHQGKKGYHQANILRAIIGGPYSFLNEYSPRPSSQYTSGHHKGP